MAELPRLFDLLMDSSDESLEEEIMINTMRLTHKLLEKSQSSSRQRKKRKRDSGHSRTNRPLPLSVVKMESSCETKPSPTVVKLKPIEATPETFREFGQVIEASPDGEEFGPRDAQLDLSRGVPRFYITQLKGQSLKFSSITHHANVTQCLGSIGGNVWYLGVAKSSMVDPSEINGTTGANVLQSDSGHFYVPPAVDEVHAFKISGSKFIKLNRGTWHAGPLFDGGTMDFYNLELNNTNVVDHTTHYFNKKNNVVFHLEE